MKVLSFNNKLTCISQNISLLDKTGESTYSYWKAIISPENQAVVPEMIIYKKPRLFIPESGGDRKYFYKARTDSLLQHTGNVNPDPPFLEPGVYTCLFFFEGGELAFGGQIVLW